MRVALATFRAGLVAASLVLLGSSLSACHHRRGTRAPYTAANAPSAETLLAATAARYESVRVSKAKIREGRSPAARLLLRAEQPGRTLGTIEVAGNPLVQLSLHERGYALRNLRDQPGMRLGYYHGPPSRCAVRALLGVELEAEAITTLLLGGGPLLAEPYEVVSRGWEEGRERLVIRNERYEERLSFAWHAGQWWFAGAEMRERTAEGSEWLWTLEHERFSEERDRLSPELTRIRRPSGNAKGKIELSIIFLERDFVDLGQAGSEKGGGDDGEPGWQDDGGWEDDGDWEGEEDEEPAPAPQPVPVVEIPAIYQLAAGGLADRGDLCR